MGAEGKNKLLYLESLRGIAAFVVVMTHFAGSFFPAMTGGAGQRIHSPIDTWFYGTPLGIIFGGNFAVCVFFVLSGFVLTRAFFMTGRMNFLTTGAFKRYFRLMPPVAVSVIAAYLLLKFHLFFNQQAVAYTGSGGLGELWLMPAHLATAVKQAFYGAFISGTVGAAAYNPPLWTMQIEFIGSFLVFGVAALAGTHSRRWWLYAMLVAATWQTYFLGFAFGMILADMMARQQVVAAIRRRQWPMWAGLVLAGLLLGGYPAGGSTAGTMYRLFPNLLESSVQAIATWHTLGALLLVVGVAGWTGAQRVLHWKPFVILGRQSFGLYLTHLIIIATFSSYLFKTLMMTHGYRTSFLLMLGPSLLVIFAVSYLYTRWIDQPSIAWAWRMGRLANRAPAPQSDALPIPTGAVVPVSAAVGAEN